MGVAKQIGMFVVVLTLASAIGCVPPKAAKEDAGKKNDGPIFGKFTTEVGEWDPNGGQKVKENEEANLVNHIRVGATSALGSIAELTVKDALNKYNALEGHYPKTYEEFMEKVFKVYVQKLPMPVTSCEYQYDVENHRLLLVEKKKDQ